MSGIHGLLPYNQPGYFYITLEESYVTLFKIQAEQWFNAHQKEPNAEEGRSARLAHAVAKAYITDVLHHLSNKLFLETGSEKDIWVFLSFPELENRLHGACKIRTLKDAMKEMIEDDYVYKRPNRNPAYKALEYRLNLPRYRSDLNALPKKSDEKDRAKMHDDSANLHDDSANLHDDSANLHARKNIDLTKNKQRENESATPTSQQPQQAPSHTPPSFSSSQEKEHHVTDGSKMIKTREQLPIELRWIHEALHAHNCNQVVLGEYEAITPGEEAHYVKIAKYVPTEKQLPALDQREKALRLLVLHAKAGCEKLKDTTCFLGNVATDAPIWRQTYKLPTPPAQNAQNRPVQARSSTLKSPKELYEEKRRELDAAKAQAAKQNTEEPAPARVLRRPTVNTLDREREERQAARKARAEQAQATPLTSETASLLQG